MNINTFVTSGAKRNATKLGIIRRNLDKLCQNSKWKLLVESRRLAEAKREKNE
jgi:hypothetical protein